MKYFKLKQKFFFIFVIKILLKFKHGMKLFQFPTKDIDNLLRFHFYSSGNILKSSYHIFMENSFANANKSIHEKCRTNAEQAGHLVNWVIDENYSDFEIKSHISWNQTIFWKLYKLYTLLNCGNPVLRKTILCIFSFVWEKRPHFRGRDWLYEFESKF